MDLLLIIGVVFSVVLAILWAILPFAVFGTKDRLDRVSSQLEEIKTALKTIGFLLAKTDKALRINEEIIAAVAEIEREAVQGDKDAQHQLGLMYYNGDNVSKDYLQAFKWFNKAAEQGDPESQYYLGVMYIYGHGVSRDDQEGVKWLCKASAQDFEPAQKYLRTWGIKCDR